jgi:hypothetical protein
MIVALLFSCFTTQTDSLEPWPTEPKELVQRCNNESLEEFKITCRVQAAALFGMRGEEASGASLCQQINDVLWQEECHFRLGEELAVSGNLTAGLRHCALAGRFSQNCLTHAIWRNPQSIQFPSKNGAQKILNSYQEWQSAAQSSLQELPHQQQIAAMEDLNARFGYSVYFGTGELYPEPAHLSGPLGTSLRTGFAMEAARLFSFEKKVSIERIITLWESGKTYKGEATNNAYKQGRHYPAILSPFEKEVPKINIYGGGKRLVANTPKEDIIIAAMEAMYWLEDTPPEIFLPWIDHSSGPIRWTAVKLLRLCHSKDFAWENTFNQILQNGDPAAKWHIHDAIKKTTHIKR